MTAENNAENKNETKKSFSQTLNLPKTDFPLRPNNKVDDPELLKRWVQEDLYIKSFEHNKNSKKYILHDGPPYANGDIHLGHAYNKILKDIITKARRMMGYHVPVTPGWDCHGLPIERKVTEENPGLDPVELKKACRKYANHWIDVQRNSFKSLGILMNWDHPYITMDFSYESKIIKALGIIVSQGFLERKNKTVPWCFHDKTVLASAEIEYYNRKDPSIYVLFDLTNQDSKCLFNVDKASLIVWTTTPWTLPLNQAVLVNPYAFYSLYEVDGSYVIVGSEVADSLFSKIEKTAKKISTFKADLFKTLKTLPCETGAIAWVKHPFIDKEVPLIYDESVGTQEGTAFVHCAPGCGPIDYEIGVKNNLAIFSPISPGGEYTEEVLPRDLAGMPVTDGQIWVIKKLSELNKLFYKTSINHSYPHCWRCRNGLIFRATPQWFFDLDKADLKERALEAIERINFIPDRSRNFLKATVESRWEWVLSRQRIWGVSIPALICTKCDYGFLNNEIIDKVAQGVAKHGIEYWDAVDLKDLIADIDCPKCKCKDLKKEKDILDVWFDSGVSHFAVLLNNPDLGFPANLYAEGIDQHRGWFQSSLLTSLVLEKEAAMRGILTHGFTVDAKGQKMSKSLGNVVSPNDIIKNLGTDGLRLWVSSIGSDGDAVVSDALLQNVSEVYRKIRNTCRFLLSNLYDFDLEKDKIEIEKLMPIDYYALTKLELLNSELIKNYLEYDFTAIFHALAEFSASELSSYYLDITKDRLYCEKSNGYERRSAQTAIYYILDTVTKLMAPIMSFTAELVSDHYQKNKKQSIHLENFVDPKILHDLVYGKKEQYLPGLANVRRELIDIPLDLASHQKPIYLDIQWATLKEIRNAVLKAIEIEREKSIIKHSLEAQVKLFIDFNEERFFPVKELFDEIKKQGIDIAQFLKEYFIVSRVILENDKFKALPSSLEGVNVAALKAEGTKCPRCWQYDITTNPDGLCNRCQRVLNIQ